MRYSIWERASTLDPKVVDSIYLYNDMRYVRYWVCSERSLRSLSKEALRSFGTPVSSATSERVLRVIHLLVTANRNKLMDDISKDMVYA